MLLLKNLSGEMIEELTFLDTVTNISILLYMLVHFKKYIASKSHHILGPPNKILVPTPLYRLHPIPNHIVRLPIQEGLPGFISIT